MIFIIIHVMLSHPKLWSFVQSSEQHSSISSFTISSIGVLLDSLSSTKSMTSWDDLTSQIPSQPMTMKSSSSSICLTVMSGTQVIACSSGGKFLFLWFRSPRDLDKLRLPSTLPSITSLPALIIRWYSFGFSGL
jgi:hypothetical protein